MAQRQKFTAEQVFEDFFQDHDSEDEDFEPQNVSEEIRQLLDDASDPDYSSDEEEDQDLDEDSDADSGLNLPSTSAGRGDGARGRGRGSRARGRGQQARGRGRGRGQHARGRGRGRGQQARGRGRRSERAWLTDVDQYVPTIPDFTADPGVKVDTTGFKPSDFYALFVNDDLLNHMVFQTNLYATEILASTELKPASRMQRWVPTDIHEMRTFLGLLLLMGIVKKPTFQSYWCTDPLIRTQVFPAAMARDRFLLLLKFWHLNDNRNLPPLEQPGRDRLFKIRPFLDHLFDKFQEVMVPGRDVAIDESLLLWKGRLVFKQYIPLKRARFGIKSFLLCDSSGYTYRFRIYAGKDESTDAIDAALPPSADNLGRTGKEVMHLMLPLLGKGYRLFIDNWYTSADLLEILLNHNTSCCGTLRPNRTPICLRQIRVEKGETESCISGAILAQKFADKRDVYMISTCHPHGPSGDGVKPPVIREYNLKMGAVDKHDQLLQPYDATRRSIKWYKKLCVRFLQIALLNAHIVYKKTGGTLCFLEFMKQVITEYIFSGFAVPDAPDDHTVRLVGRHFADLLPPTEGKARPQKRCRVCAATKVREDTRYFCPDCPSKPGLCFPKCYKKYHTERNYWRN